MDRAGFLAKAYIEACNEEINALKPGNVHRFADGHRMVAGQFIESANISAPALINPEAKLGRRILDAVKATQVAVGTNTNLGIILLCAPIIMAAESRSHASLTQRINALLNALDAVDTQDVFQAIVIANPGGLGQSDQHDVAQPPTVSLLDAMKFAEDRDMIAKQYVTGFNDILDGGLTATEAAWQRGETGMWPTIFTYLHFLSSYPDSHIMRKHGSDVAIGIQNEALRIYKNVKKTNNLDQRLSSLIKFDVRLKSNGINPGTSADLTVATLLAEKIKINLHNCVVDG